VTANAISTIDFGDDSGWIDGGECASSSAVPPLAQDAVQRLAAIVESSDDAIIGKTLDGIITDWNQSAQRIFGYAADEIIGRPVSLLIPVTRQAEEADIVGRISRGERVAYYQTERLTRDGRIIQVMLTVSPIRDHTGKIIGASKILRDVSDQQAAQASLIRQTEALKRSNEELERYAYITSHDLQEPLRTVASFAKLLRRHCGDQLKNEGKEYLQFITDGVERMQNLIRDLLAYSRIDARGEIFGAVDCNLVVAKILEGLKAAIESEGAAISVDPLPVVAADATQLAQVFQNLLLNAIKFQSAKCSKVRIFSTEAAERWVFSVQDNGIGIAPEYFDRIFVIFQRLHTSEEYSGTGIGLAVCKKIVERHGGRIWVESALGEGSTFHFSIPKREVAE